MLSAETYLPKEEGGSCETSAEGTGSAAQQVGEGQLQPSEESCHHTSGTLQSLDCETTGNGIYLKVIVF